jgi:hypothetical protein
MSTKDEEKMTKDSLKRLDNSRQIVYALTCLTLNAERLPAAGRLSAMRFVEAAGE